jgi:hypothetical protein
MEELRNVLSTQMFLIRDVLTKYCGQTLLPNKLDEIVEVFRKEITKGTCHWAFLEQKLSKQVTEEEFKKFMVGIYYDWRNNPDKTAIDYMLENIFSHYILIPKE